MAAKIERKIRTAKRFGDIFVNYRLIPSKKKITRLSRLSHSGLVQDKRDKRDVFLFRLYIIG